MSIPTHIGIIMDGNGRWAKAKGLIRMYGHKKGLEVAEEIIDFSQTLGIKYLSLYVFSTENWKRPKAEVDSLFSLADKYLSRLEKFCKNRVRIVVSGERKGLPEKLVSKIKKIEQATKNFDGICVNLCINYGGQNEIVKAANALVKSNSEITVESLSEFLYNSFI